MLSQPRYTVKPTEQSAAMFVSEAPTMREGTEAMRHLALADARASDTN
jgi:hypothetical protein